METIRIWIFVVLAAGTIAGCGNGAKTEAGEMRDSVVVEEGNVQTKDSVVAFVTRMYADVFSTIEECEADWEEMYFSKSLFEDYRDAIACCFDPDPDWEQHWPHFCVWVGTRTIKHPKLLGVEVKELSSDKAKVVAKFRPHEELEYTEAELDMSLVWEGGWRVDDFTGGLEPSVRQSARKFFELTKEHLADEAIAALEDVDPVKAVRAMYNDFAFMYEPDYLGTMYRQKYFTRDFHSLRSLAENMAEERHDLLIDYDEWIAAQDYDKVSVASAELLESSDSTARVQLKISLGEGTETSVTAILKREDGRWHVDDLLSDSTSVRRLCEEYIELCEKE